MSESRERKRHTGLVLGWVGLVEVLALASSPARAQEALFNAAPTLGDRVSTGDVHAGFAYASNPQLVNSGSGSDTIASVGLDLDAHHTGAMLDLAGRGSVDWVDYLKGTYRSLPLGNLTGSAMWGKNSDLFQFGVTDNFAQSSYAPFAAATPDNIENTNLLTAGPALNLHFGANTRLTFSGVYSKSTYEVSDFDSQDYTGAVTLSQKLSKSTSVALNASDQDTSYAASSFPGFHIAMGTLSLVGTGQRTAVTLDAGYATLNQRGQDSTGFTGHFDLERQISVSSKLYAHLRQNFVTAAQQGSGAAVVGGISPSVIAPGLISTADPLLDRGADAGWRFDRPRTGLQLSGTWSEEHYFDDTQYNRQIFTVMANATRRLSPTLTLALSGWLVHERYENVYYEDSEKVVSLLLSKSLGRSMSLSVYGQRAARSGSVVSEDYADNVVGIQVAYGLFGNVSGLGGVRVPGMGGF